MEDFDSKKAQRVWQRVQAHKIQEEPEVSLQSLARDAVILSGQYLRMARRFYGREKQRLLQMAAQLKNHSRVLGQLEQGIRRRR